MDQGSKDEEEKDLTHPYGIHHPVPSGNYANPMQMQKTPEMENHPQYPIGHQPYLPQGMSSGLIRPSPNNVSAPDSCQSINTFPTNSHPQYANQMSQGLHHGYDESTYGRNMNYSVSNPYSHYGNTSADFNINSYSRMPYSGELNSNGCVPNISSPQMGNFMPPTYGNSMGNPPVNTPMINSHQGFSDNNYSSAETNSPDDYLKRMKNKRSLGNPSIGAPAPKIKRKRQKDPVEPSHRSDPSPSIPDLHQLHRTFAPQVLSHQSVNSVQMSQAQNIPTSLSTDLHSNSGSNFPSTVTNFGHSSTTPSPQSSLISPVPQFASEENSLNISPNNQIIQPDPSNEYNTPISVASSNSLSGSSTLNYMNMDANASLAGIENLIRETSSSYEPLHKVQNTDVSRKEDSVYTEKESSKPKDIEKSSLPPEDDQTQPETDSQQVENSVTEAFTQEEHITEGSSDTNNIVPFSENYAQEQANSEQNSNEASELDSNYLEGSPQAQTHVPSTPNEELEGDLSQMKEYEETSPEAEVNLTPTASTEQLEEEEHLGEDHSISPETGQQSETEFAEASLNEEASEKNSLENSPNPDHSLPSESGELKSFDAENTTDSCVQSESAENEAIAVDNLPEASEESQESVGLQDPLGDCQEEELPHGAVTDSLEEELPHGTVTDCQEEDSPRDTVTDCQEEDSPRDTVTDCQEEDSPRDTVTDWQEKEVLQEEANDPLESIQEKEKVESQPTSEKPEEAQEKDKGVAGASEDEDDPDSMKPPMRKLLGTGTGLSAKPKVKNLRRNIREIIGDDKLEENTLAAQKEEQQRLQRLQEKRVAMREYMEQQQVERLVAEVAEAAEAVTAAEAVEEAEAIDAEIEAKSKPVEDDIVVLSPEEPKVKLSDSEPETEEDMDDDDEQPPELLVPKKEIKSEPEDSDDQDSELDKSKHSEESDSGSDSDVVVLSQSEEEDEDEDINNSGSHINDNFNSLDAQGRVLVNVGHPEKEEDIFLPPQLATAVKPHQVGGIRFLYDNLIESLEQFKTSNGFGCILAHSMGLGKTLQVVSFTDILLRHTDSKHVLIIVPINTLQNWLSEYNQWLPETVPADLPEGVEVRPRQFKVLVINDAHKSMVARARVIREWSEDGGVLLMGYELYRQISLRKPKKPKKKKKRIVDNEIVDIEEEDKNKVLLDEMQKALVRPGPDLVICDEGHRIKNAHANISQALKTIRTKRRVVLTGYPLQNNLLEYWCMVDFVRPNYLGTKTEFSNMFERPIQNGQCVDSTRQDVKVMRYRAHVLHSLLEGFVQRRGHSVLAKSLPSKHEHIVLCRMTPMQRKLYSAYMAELTCTKATANPLKAFAICCKIWNHPDVMYNFVMKRMNEDYDLDLDEVVGKPKKNKKGAAAAAKEKANAPPNPQTPSKNTNWGASPNDSTLPQPGMTTSGQSTPMSSPSPMPSMGMSNMGQQGMPPQNMMHPGMSHQGMTPPHNQNTSMQHQGMGMNRDGSNTGMAMGGYGMGMYNMQHGYNMHQMPPPPYPWMGYNQGYPNPNDPNMQQHYPSPYGPPYAHYPQMPPHMQPQTPNQQQQSQAPPQQQSPLPPHMQQPQNMPSYSPLLPPHMQPPMNMAPPPAHPSMYPATSQPSGDPTMQNNQQGALNLSHQSVTSQGMLPNNPNMAAGISSNQMIPKLEPNIQTSLPSESMLPQVSSCQEPKLPSLGDQSSNPMESQSMNAMMQASPGQALQPNQIKQENMNENSMYMNSPNLGQSPMNFSNPMGNFMQQSPQQMQSQMHQPQMSQQQLMPHNPFQTNSGEMPLISNQMKDLALGEAPENIKEEANVKGEDLPPCQNLPIKSIEDVKDANIKESSESKEQVTAKDSDEENEDKKDEKQETKKEEMSFDWAEAILKDYTPGLLANSTKFQIFFKILEGALKVNDRLLVFSQSLFTLSLLEEFLQRVQVYGTAETWAKGRTYYRLDGSTSAQDREKLINDFNSNENVKLFLVSTRAGSLGINLVGANRVIVFDASFNPCHDTQAVCRVYRYGQVKSCHIYRLVTDNSLERRIYDRQVNKQGISDRIVDEMNPEAHLSSKEISNLLVENEEDPDPDEFPEKESTTPDEILLSILEDKKTLLTLPPFSHESLLVDRKDKKLSNAEKRLAKRSYELEKQANISYSRPQYGGFYSKSGGPQTFMMGTKIGGVVYAKPVGTVRPMQSEMGQKIEGGGAMMHRPNILSRSGQSSNYPVETLAKQGVSVQQITVPKDVSIPTNSGDGKPIQLKSGQSVMVIKTQKGMYLRLSDGKIVAIRVPAGNESALGLPLNQGSVTIVPTMVNKARQRGGARGGVTPTRRGRPPMAAQYALGQVVPKGTSKGQMAVRILRKPIIGSRGGRAYQTIAIPVSSSSQGTLLNKSVVITPAKSRQSAKSIKDLKISPKVQITPVPSKKHLSSIGGASGLTKRLNRNTKIISAQAAHASKFVEERQTKLKTNEHGDSSEDSLSSSDQQSPASVTNEDMKAISQASVKSVEEPDKASVSSPMEADNAVEESPNQGREEEGGIPSDLADLKTSADGSMTSPQKSTSDIQSNSPLKGFESDQDNNAQIGQSNTQEFDYSNSPTTTLQSTPSIDSHNLNLSEFEQSKKSPLNEPLTGIVRPMVHHSSGTSETSLEGLNSLMPQIDETSEKSPPTYNKSLPSNVPQPNMTSPQPLFQPFLQQPTTTIPKVTTATSLLSSTPNVALVTPQVQGLATNLMNQSPFSSADQSLFTNTTTKSPMQGLHSLSSNLNFNMGAATSLNQPHTPLLNPSGILNPTSSAPSSMLSPYLSQSPSAPSQPNSSISSGDNNPLSLSNLLPSPSISQASENNHPTSMEHLNYSISNSSAFRRPDFPGLSPDLQSLINPSPMATPTSTPPSIVAATSTSPSTQATTPAVCSPSFTDPMSSPYHYASPYRTHTSTGFRTPSMAPGYPYSGQYGSPFASQYPGIPPATIPSSQPTPMNQFSGIQTNPYQGFAPPTPSSLPPYSPSLGGFPSSYPPPPPPSM